MRGSILIVLLLCWGQDAVRSIRLVELRVPGHAAAGGEALLGCQFDLQGELLYSVKWYKDGREFYRYLPRDSLNQTSMWFKRPGVTVDLSRSSSDVVTLINLQPESAGVYRCEVSGEAPAFRVAADERYVNIHVLPKSNPTIKGLKFQYEFGDRLTANCTSTGSRPEAVIKWLINNKPVHRVHLRGPWHRVVQDPPDTIETTLGLSIMVLPEHYKTGVMQIKCQATIAPLYQREKVFILNPPDTEPDTNSSDEEEPSPETEIPTLDVPDEEDRVKNIRDKFENRFEELAGTVQLQLPSFNLPPVTTEVPLDEKDYATRAKRGLELIVIALLMQVILL